jgi:hypothetical protein
MTKIRKTAIFFTNMRINPILLLCLISLFSCKGSRDEGNVIPPVTAPLSREFIGYGVITDSFTHVTVDPQDNSISLGYLRRGSLVRLIRRQTVKTESGFQSWLLTDDPQHGWLKENVMDVYSTESQARTASEQITGSREQ